MVLKKEKNIKCFLNGIEEFKKMCCRKLCNLFKVKIRVDKVIELIDIVLI